MALVAQDQLFLVVHRVETETAKVPLSMIILMDHVKRRSLPPSLKCRLVLPCGDTSVSVWDAPTEAELQQWIDDTLGAAEPGLISTTHEVQEDFSWGMTTVLAQARAAEKVVAGSKTALSTLSRGAAQAQENLMKQLEVFDNKTHLLSNTAEAVANLRTKTAQAMESQRVASAREAAGEIGRSFSASVTSWFTKVSAAATGPAGPAFSGPSSATSTGGSGTDGSSWGVLHTTLPADSMSRSSPANVPVSTGSSSSMLDRVDEGVEEGEQHQQQQAQQHQPPQRMTMDERGPAPAAAAATGAGAGASVEAAPAAEPQEPPQPTFTLSDELLDVSPTFYDCAEPLPASRQPA